MTLLQQSTSGDIATKTSLTAPTGGNPHRPLKQPPPEADTIDLLEADNSDDEVDDLLCPIRILERTEMAFFWNNGETERNEMPDYLTLPGCQSVARFFQKLEKLKPEAYSERKMLGVQIKALNPEMYRENQVAD